MPNEGNQAAPRKWLCGRRDASPVAQHDAPVLGPRTQDHDLRWGLLEQPDQILAREADARERCGRHDHAVEALLVQEPQQRVLVGAAALDPRINGNALSLGPLLDRLEQRHSGR